MGLFRWFMGCFYRPVCSFKWNGQSVILFVQRGILLRGSGKHFVQRGIYFMGRVILLVGSNH